MNNQLDDYMNAHPRECLLLVIIAVSFVWQSVITLLGLMLYVFLIRRLKISPFIILLNGLILALAIFYLQSVHSFKEILLKVFYANVTFWKLIAKQQVINAFFILLHDIGNDLFGLPLLLAGMLGLVDLIPVSPHEKIMQALQQGQHLDDRAEVVDHVLRKTLDRLKEKQYDGTLLGVSKYTSNALVIPDRDVNQVVLVLGTTGSGKTITLRRFYQRAIMQGYPLIIIDGKPDETNIATIKQLADQCHRRFMGFNCGNHLNYDCLANGSYTELKDKIICLKDQWESDYYRSIAEDYLQTTLEVLIKSGKEFDLKKVVHCLSYKNLVKIVSEIDDQSLKDRVAALKEYGHQDIKGLQAHLHILIHSELGQFFKKNSSAFSLSDVIKENGIAYFALPALRFPSFSKVLGKLVINDIKALIDRQMTGQPIFTIFDEFSVFAGEQVLNLVNMGRGKGLHAVFGTQGLADLDRVDIMFKDQVLNCTNTLICHRLNDQTSAEGISNWIGTKDGFTITAQLNSNQDAGLGSVRRNKEFIVHPDSIKQGLRTGEAFYVSKVGEFKWEKVRVRL